MKKKIILVTGGAGFVGSNLCEKLAQNSENQIYSLDNYFTGTAENHINGITYINGDTENIDKLVKINPDIIYHLGEYSRVEQSFDDISLVWKYNKIGTLAVLEFARKKNCKIVYAGSSTKFGDGGEGGNSSPYAWSKSSNTELVKNYGNWFGLDFAITYFYNVYGKNEIADGKYATLIALFLNKKKNNLPLTIVKPGTQERNFTHVNDIVNGLILVGEKGYGDGFGIGSEKVYTIKDVAKLFESKIEYIDERKGNRLKAELVTENTKKLGWSATHSLEDYIFEKLKELK